MTLREAVRAVALLRGINVGRAKRVAMADLRSLMAELGFDDVRTLLNSGNIIFTDPKGKPVQASGRIERAIADQLGVSTRVLVITAAELGEIIRENQLTDIASDPSRLLVAVLADSKDRAALEPLAGLDWGPEALSLGRRAAYLWCADGAADSPLWQAVTRALHGAVTARNWNTVLKLKAGC